MYDLIYKIYFGMYIGDTYPTLCIKIVAYSFSGKEGAEDHSFNLMAQQIFHESGQHGRSGEVPKCSVCT